MVPTSLFHGTLTLQPCAQLQLVQRWPSAVHIIVKSADTDPVLIVELPKPPLRDAELTYRRMTDLLGQRCVPGQKTRAELALAGLGLQYAASPFWNVSWLAAHFFGRYYVSISLCVSLLSGFLLTTCTCIMRVWARDFYVTQL